MSLATSPANHHAFDIKLQLITYQKPPTTPAKISPYLPHRPEIGIQGFMHHPLQTFTHPPPTHSRRPLTPWAHPQKRSLQTTCIGAVGGPAGEGVRQGEAGRRGRPRRGSRPARHVSRADTGQKRVCCLSS